ncbi:MAG: hypothetical protein AAFQ83_26420 [Bacteroidota bacterium]
MMQTQQLKLELIEWILHTNQKELLQKLAQLKAEDFQQKQQSTRKAGWGKHLVGHIAPDFDETPEGFEEYMP